MNDADVYLEEALNKKRFKDTVSFNQILEGENAFYRQRQLYKGTMGSDHKDAEYYWSDKEGMTFRPAKHRYPIIRGNKGRDRPDFKLRFKNSIKD